MWWCDEGVVTVFFVLHNAATGSSLVHQNNMLESDTEMQAAFGEPSTITTVRNKKQALIQVTRLLIR
jgi:hypothetical protein